MANEWREYEWLVVCGALAAFVMAYGIGANDVANAFATSVGSKALKIWQACAIAAVCEFLGAMLLGGEVTGTIRGSIANLARFQRHPELLAYGMLCAVTTAAIWLLVATYLGLAISTTHSIIGAIIGFAMTWKGTDAVLWWDYDGKELLKDPPKLPIKGVGVIVLSWTVSPIMCGVLAAFLFLVNRTLVLRSKYSMQRSFWVLPIMVAITVYINCFFILSKGKAICATPDIAPKGTELCKANKDPAKREVDINGAAWISAVVAAGLSLISAIVFVPLIRSAVLKEEAQRKTESVNVQKKEVAPFGATPVTVEVVPGSAPAAASSTGHVNAFQALTYGLRYDIHDAVKDNKAAVALADNMEKFDPATESTYKYLQIFSAMCDSFSHGANDVANSVAPLAAIYHVYRYRNVLSNSETPAWILAIGATGIVIGLATYGYNIMRVLGVEMVSITPSRGFSIETGTALVIGVGSFYGFPLSTTQAQVGGTVGVGLVEGVSHGVNWKVLLKTFLAWVFTLIITALMCAAMFAQGIYSPSWINLEDIERYELAIFNVTSLMASNMNSTYHVLGRVNSSAVSTNYNRSLNANVRDAGWIGKVSKGAVTFNATVSSISASRLAYRIVTQYIDNSVLTFNSSNPSIGGFPLTKAEFRALRGANFTRLP